MANPEEMKRKLEEMEADVSQTISAAASTDTGKSLVKMFDGLPTIAKVGIVGVGLVLGLSILSMVLKVVMSIVVIGVLSVAAFIAYRLFLAND